MTDNTPDIIGIAKELQERLADFYANPNEGGIDWIPVGVTDLDSITQAFLDRDHLLMTQCDNCKALEERLKIAVEALEFYGHQDHYVIEGDGGFGSERLLEYGDKAREALSRIRS